MSSKRNERKLRRIIAGPRRKKPQEAAILVVSDSRLQHLASIFNAKLTLQCFELKKEDLHLEDIRPQLVLNFKKFDKKKLFVICSVGTYNMISVVKDKCLECQRPYEITILNNSKSYSSDEFAAHLYEKFKATYISLLNVLPNIMKVVFMPVVFIDFLEIFNKLASAHYNIYGHMLRLCRNYDFRKDNLYHHEALDLLNDMLFKEDFSSETFRTVYMNTFHRECSNFVVNLDRSKFLNDGFYLLQFFHVPLIFRLKSLYFKCCREFNIGYSYVRFEFEDLKFIQGVVSSQVISFPLHKNIIPSKVWWRIASNHFTVRLWRSKSRCKKVHENLHNLKFILLRTEAVVVCKNTPVVYSIFAKPKLKLPPLKNKVTQSNVESKASVQSFSESLSSDAKIMQPEQSTSEEGKEGHTYWMDLPFMQQQDCGYSETYQQQDARLCQFFGVRQELHYPDMNCYSQVPCDNSQVTQYPYTYTDMNCYSQLPYSNSQVASYSCNYPDMNCYSQVPHDNSQVVQYPCNYPDTHYSSKLTCNSSQVMQSNPECTWQKHMDEWVTFFSSQSVHPDYESEKDKFYNMCINSFLNITNHVDQKSFDEEWIYVWEKKLFEKFKQHWKSKTGLELSAEQIHEATQSFRNYQFLFTKKDKPSHDINVPATASTSSNMLDMALVSNTKNEAMLTCFKLLSGIAKYLTSVGFVVGPLYKKLEVDAMKGENISKYVDNDFVSLLNTICRNLKEAFKSQTFYKVQDFIDAWNAIYWANCILNDISSRPVTMFAFNIEELAKNNIGKTPRDVTTHMMGFCDLCGVMLSKDNLKFIVHEIQKKQSDVLCDLSTFAAFAKKSVF